MTTLLTLLTRHSVIDSAAALAAKLQDGGFDTAVPMAAGAGYLVAFHGVTLKLRLGTDQPECEALKPIHCPSDWPEAGATLQIGLGDIVAGGERVPAVAKVLLIAAERLGSALGAFALIWHPAAIISGFDYFKRGVIDYADGGALPVLALVNFRIDDDGSIVTHGLSALGGQEVHASSATLGNDELMRRVARVAHDIAVNGPFWDTTRFSGLEDGEDVVVEPEAGGTMVHLSILRG